PSGFVAHIHFRNAEDERFRPVLTNYIRAESLFRQEMRQVLRVQQRTYDLTFHELCVGQPPVPVSYFKADRAATNVMTARYPFHMIKVGGVWKWDMFGGLSREVGNQRLTALDRDSLLLDMLTCQVHDRTNTNV